MAFLTILNFSAGRQSTWLLEKYLRGEWKRPKRFAVINANPGMEKQATRQTIDHYERRCERAGILFVRAPGPDLYTDFVNWDGRKRIDTPPFWTKNPDGTTGALNHQCTREYKIRPIRRAARRVLESTRFWGSIQAKQSVEFQICFSYEEKHRIKDGDHPQWAFASHPLIANKVTLDDIHSDFRRWGIPIPVMSLCNGCPFHGLRSRRDQSMVDQDWHEAITFDGAIRDLRHIGVENECYTSDILLPIIDLQSQGFSLGDEKADDLHSCTSGMCFV